MKIDFKKLKKLELEYKENIVCLNSIQILIELVLGYDETRNLELAPINIKLAKDTLLDLGILKETPIKIEKDIPGHLNS